MENNLIDTMIVPFVNSYLATAAWVTCDSDENTDFTRDAKKTATNDCKLFIDKVFAAFPIEQAETILNMPGNDLTHLSAHNFFLTRNHHGAGFWDSPHIYGEEAAKILTQISDDMKGVDCYHLRGPKSKLTF